MRIRVSDHRTDPQHRAGRRLRQPEAKPKREAFGDGVSASQFDKHKAWTVIGDGDDTRHGVCTMYCSCRLLGGRRGPGRL